MSQLFNTTYCHPLIVPSQRSTDSPSTSPCCSSSPQDSHPCSYIHLRQTWATIFPLAFAISMRTSFSITWFVPQLVPFAPKGEKAMTTIPFALQKSLSFFCYQTGLISTYTISQIILISFKHYILFVEMKSWSCYSTGLTWFTAGGIVEEESRFWSFLQEKLLSPMNLARPSLWHSSMVAHTDLKSMGIKSSSAKGHPPFLGFTMMGQWIKYTTYSNWRVLHKFVTSNIICLN